jgi:hypothetical protein
MHCCIASIEVVRPARPHREHDHDAPGSDPRESRLRIGYGRFHKIRAAFARQELVNPGLIALVRRAGQSGRSSQLAGRSLSPALPVMTWLKTDPRFDKIRQEPRFQELMRGVGLV